MKKKIFLISLIFFLIDQIIKLFVLKYLTVLNVIPGFLSLVYSENKGVAFSMLWGNRWIIILISILLVSVLFTIINKEYLKKEKDNNINNFTYGILIGGIFGNLFDRVLRGYVIDYVALKFFDYSFPIFNLADIFITIGVILIVISLIKEDLVKQKN